MSTARRSKFIAQPQPIRRPAAAVIDLSKLSPLSHKLSAKAETALQLSKWRDIPKDHERLRS